MSICIYQYDGTNYSGISSAIPVNTENTYTVTTRVKDTTLALWLGIEFQQYTQESATFYTDNWILKEVWL